MELKNRVTQKVLLEAANICNKYGYWSDEVREYLSQFTNNASNKIESALRSVYVSVNARNKEYEELFTKHGYFNGIQEAHPIMTQEEKKACDNWIKIEADRLERTGALTSAKDVIIESMC